MKKPTSKKQANGQALKNRLPKNQGERLELMIKLTERAIDNDSDHSLSGQLKRLKVELKNWKSS